MEVKFQMSKSMLKLSDYYLKLIINSGHKGSGNEDSSSRGVKASGSFFLSIISACELDDLTKGVGDESSFAEAILAGGDLDGGGIHVSGTESSSVLADEWLKGAVFTSDGGFLGGNSGDEKGEFHFSLLNYKV